MKSNKRLIIGLALLLTGVAGLLAIRSNPMLMGGMGMMGQGTMKEMMKRMMGDQLPSGIDAADLPNPKSSGAALLARYCTQCHDLPPPALHSSGEWPNVLERMDRRMEMMPQKMDSILSPTDQDRSVILSYLRLHAADNSEQANE